MSKKKDEIVRLPMTKDSWRMIYKYHQALAKARAENDVASAAEAAFTYGLEYGIALCREAAAINSQWSDPRKKKEWCKYFDADWRTVRDNHRTREITSKIVQIHVDDLKTE